MTIKTIVGSACSLAVLTLSLAACGDDSNFEPSLDASTVDAPLSPLVGTWNRRSYQEVDSTKVVTFTDQGGLRWGETSGKWRITADGRLKAGAVPTKPVGVADFYLSPDHNTLMLEVLLPTTPTDGLVGTWEGKYEYADGASVVTKMEFRADHTVTWSDKKGAATRSDEGTWKIEDESAVIVEAKLNGTTPVIVGSRLIPDVALGTDLLYRNDP